MAARSGNRCLPLVAACLSVAVARSAAGDDAEDAAKSAALARADELDAEIEDLRAEGRHVEAMPLARESLELRERALGPNHPDVALSLSNLGLLLWDDGSYAEARQLLERALAIDEGAHGEHHTEVATDLHNLATVLHDLGSYADALPMFKRALAIREKAYGKDQPEVATVLDNLASLLHDLGAYEEARSLYERALSIREEALGADDPDVALSLNGLALLLYEQGLYAEARPLFERALAINEGAYGRYGREVATSLVNLACLLCDQGSYAEAGSLCRRALAIDEKALGKEHPGTADTLHALAFVLDAQGLGDEARPVLQRALAIREKALGKDHPVVATSLGSLALLLCERGSYSEARTLLDRALLIREKVLGEGHPDVGVCLHNIGGLYVEQGRHAEARPFFERAIAIREAALGKDHQRVAGSLDLLASVLDAQGCYVDARPLHLRALAAGERSLRASLAGLSTVERVRFSASLRKYLDGWLEVAPHSAQSGHAEVLRLKGMVARAVAAEQALLRSRGAEGSIEKLRAAVRRLARLATAMPPASQSEQQAQWRKNYAQTAAERERLSLALAKEVAPYRAALERLDLGVTDIQAQLREGEALVDVLRSSGRYLAWVVGREGEALRLDLGEAAEIERVAAAFVHATRGAGAGRGLEEEGGTGDRDAGRRLRALVWEPIASKLPEGTSTVFVSPDAALAAVPLAALPGNEDGKCLIDEVSIVLLSMAQDLVPWPSRAEGEGALVLGGVDFGKAGTAEELDADPQVTVLARAADRAPRGEEFGALPGTAAEAAEVGERLSALALTGADATEARLRREAKGKRVLHLATHGYVREDLMRGLHRGRDEAFAEAALERHLAAGHDPMLLSGLALAGANTGDGGYGDDGILSALEASMLDLERCDLVVLSACETAKGTAESGEGVLGLVTGFRIAGAKRVIGSLWKVDDEATRLLMGRFYEGVLRKKLEPAEALREAALWLRMQRGAGGRPFDAPRYWAAFVAYGR